MSVGFMEKLLYVDLSSGRISEEVPPEELYRDFIGGYGVGARILYSRQRPGVDPLGPENILGFITGPLTGSPAPGGCRYMAVAKSPLTYTWGDANSGGFFGPELKFAGFDGVFFTGISEKPVYLFVNNGKAELRDAAHLWGKSTYDTEDMLQAELGEAAKAVCIGPSGEKLSLISGIITIKGAAAARSGLGAVMGSKRLKAVVTMGNRKLPMADPKEAERLRKEQVGLLRKSGFLERFHHTGTGGHADKSALSGDSPVKNWGGVGIIDLPDVSGLHGDMVIANVVSRSGCWRCPAACAGIYKEGTGDFKYPAGTRRPEYETLAAFGSLCLNSNAESIAMANHICNSYGLDTISAGATVAFAIECYENGLINRSDTDGIEMTWGNPKSIVAMTEKLALREGFGDVLADGVKVAAEKIGRGSERFAVHAGGQEPGMHDPKFGHNPAFPGQPSAAMFQMDSTPGRHTAGFGPSGFENHLCNAMGVCGIVFRSPFELREKYIVGYMKAVTGLDRDMDELLKAGERIANIRHAFNLREGINHLEVYLHPRVIGDPPQKEGPLAGRRANLEGQIYWNLGRLDWDMATTRPSKKKLIELGLNDLIDDIWPSAKTPAPAP